MSRPITSSTMSSSSLSVATTEYHTANSGDFNDPLIILLHSNDLNKDKQLSNELYEYIDEINDNDLKKWCIESLTTLRNLEKIEVKLNDWEFQTLDFTIEIDNEEKNNNVKDNPIQEKLANRVIEKSNILRSNLLDQSIFINESVKRSSILSRNDPKKIISDGGTILVELTVKIVKLSRKLDKLVTIGYSRAKLTLIGLELKKLLNLNCFLIDIEIVKNYKKFVNNLLIQLNIAVAHNDTVGLWETVGIVGDVEKMFESMKRGSNKNNNTVKLESSTNANNDYNNSNNNKNRNSNIDINNDITSMDSPIEPNSSISDDRFISNNDDIDTEMTTPLSDNVDTKISTDYKMNQDDSKSGNEFKNEFKNDKYNIPKTKAMSHISAKEIFDNDDVLFRTKLSDHMPEMIGVFQRESTIDKKGSDIGIDKNENNKVNVKIDNSEMESSAGSFFPFFKPSLLNSFYSPIVKEPIYINSDKKSTKKPLTIGDGEKSRRLLTGDELDEENREDENEESVRSNLLTNSSIAVRLGQISQDDEAKNKLLQKEQELKDQELLMESSCISLKGMNSGVQKSAILSQMNSSILSKTMFSKPSSQ